MIVCVRLHLCVCVPSYSNVNEAEIEDSARKQPAPPWSSWNEGENQSYTFLLSFTLITLIGLQTPFRADESPFNPLTKKE